MSSRIYNFLLHLLPREFERAHATAMMTLATDLRREASNRSWRNRVGLEARLLLDLLWTAVTLHRSPPQSPNAPRRRTPSPRRLVMFDGITSDLRDAVRALRRSPVHCLAVVLTLALGIGANAAVFSVVDAVLLRGLPFAEADELMLLSVRNPERGWDQNPVAPANFLDWKDQSRSFAGMAGFSDWSDQQVLTRGESSSVVHTRFAVGDVFGLLRVPMALGQSFPDSEVFGQAAADAVIVSDALWRNQLDADPAVVGRAVTLNGRSRTVIGVLPASFRFNGPADVWRQFAWSPDSRAEVWFRRAHMFRGIGRLAPDVTREAAQEEMAAIAARLEKQYPETNRFMGVNVSPLADYLVGSVARPLTLLFVAVGLVLLVAAVNAAHLQLARAAARAEEDGVRACLGASPWRQLRRRLLESGVLSFLGALAGLALAAWATPILARLGGEALPGFAEIRSGTTVLAFALLLSLVTTLVSGLAPALRTARQSQSGNAALATALRESRGGDTPARARLTGFLVGCEIALAAVVVAGALLLVRSLASLHAVNPGFDGEHVLTAGVTLAPGLYPEEAERHAFLDRAAARVRAIPGVESAGFTRSLPLTRDSWSSDFAIEGRGREDFGIEVLHREVSPGYFETLRVPVLAGRRFEASDDAAATRVVVVNEALVRQHYPGRDPAEILGQRLCFDRYPDADSVWRTVVGVVGGERQDALGLAARPEIFAPLAQSDNRSASLVVRSSRPVESLAADLRLAFAEVDRRIPIFDVRAMSEVRAASLRRERFVLTLFCLFAGLSLCLASLGVYGVTAGAATRRRREIGIRMAVGALPREVAAHLLRRFLRPVAIGLVAGSLGSLALGAAMRSLLFGVGGADPLTLVVAPAVLLTTAVAAMSWPLWQASRIAPASVLRGD